MYTTQTQCNKNDSFRFAHILRFGNASPSKIYVSSVVCFLFLELFRRTGSSACEAYTLKVTVLSKYSLADGCHFDHLCIFAFQRKPQEDPDKNFHLEYISLQAFEVDR